MISKKCFSIHLIFLLFLTELSLSQPLSEGMSSSPILTNGTVVKCAEWNQQGGWIKSKFKAERALDGLLGADCLFSDATVAVATAEVQLKPCTLYDLWARVYDEGSQPEAHDFKLKIDDVTTTSEYRLATSDYNSPYHIENIKIKATDPCGGYVWERLGPLVTGHTGHLRLVVSDPDRRGSALDVLVFYETNKSSLACDFSQSQMAHWSHITRGGVVPAGSGFQQEPDPLTGRLAMTATIAPTAGPGLNGDQWLSVLSQDSLAHLPGEPFSFHLSYRVDDHYLGQDNYLGVFIDSTDHLLPDPCQYGSCFYNNLLYDAHQPTWSLFNDGFFHWKELAGGKCVIGRNWDFIFGYGTDQLNYLVPGATDKTPPTDKRFPAWSLTDYHVYSFYFNGQEGLAYIDGLLADRYWVPELICKGPIEREDLNPTFIESFNKPGYLRILLTALGDGRDPFAAGMDGYMECTCPQTPAIYDPQTGQFQPKTARVYLDWILLNTDTTFARRLIQEGRLLLSTAKKLALSL
jgi:hypothetical protein